MCALDVLVVFADKDNVPTCLEWRDQLLHKGLCVHIQGAPLDRTGCFRRTEECSWRRSISEIRCAQEEKHERSSLKL